MRKRAQKSLYHRPALKAFLAGITVAFLVMAGANRFVQAFSQASDGALRVTLEGERVLLPDDKIELKFNRELKSSEGRPAILLGQTDLTNLFTRTGTTLTYNRKILPLPPGENDLIVYLVSADNQWQEIARFPLSVSTEKKAQPPAGEKNPENTGENSPSQTQTTQPESNAKQGSATPVQNTEANPATAQPADGNASPAQPQADTQAKRAGFEKLNFTPSLTIGFKSQAAESHFPDSNRPQRPTFADLTLQGTFKSEMTRGLFNSQTDFNIAGSSFQQEALRFAQLGKDAPHIDLSSYLMQFQIGKAKIVVGHTAFGTNRQLINGFSSRGITVTMPFLKRFDLSLAAMNGTSIVGFDNFFGVSRSNHQILSGTIGMEFLPKRPGGARLEVSVLNGYVQALTNVSQGNINDVDRSRGAGFRFVAGSANGRWRFDGGFTRSKFISPADPLLNQGKNVVTLPDVTRNAHYLETGYELLKDIALTEKRKLTLTLNYRREQVDPLFRSVAAPTQADKVQNQFEMIATVGEITATVSHQRFNDNLRDVPSILKSLTRGERFAFGAPLVAIFGNPGKPNPFLPRVGYSFDRLHQFGAAIPVNGGFEVALSAIPNLFATNQSFNADWQFQKLRVGYRFNRSFQNNQQPGREFADFINSNNAVSAGFNPLKSLDTTFELSRESANNIETNRLDHTLRLASIITWRINQRATYTANLAATLAGNVAETTRNRNLDFDTQFSYKFDVGKDRFKKFQTQGFIRYSNHYIHARDFLVPLNNLTKSRTLNVGLNVTFF